MGCFGLIGNHWIWVVTVLFILYTRQYSFHLSLFWISSYVYLTLSRSLSVPASLVFSISSLLYNALCNFLSFTFQVTDLLFHFTVINPIRFFVLLSLCFISESYVVYFAYLLCQLHNGFFTYYVSLCFWSSLWLFYFNHLEKQTLLDTGHADVFCNCGLWACCMWLHPDTLCTLIEVCLQMVYASFCQAFHQPGQPVLLFMFISQSRFPHHGENKFKAQTYIRPMIKTSPQKFCFHPSPNLDQEKQCSFIF